MNRSKGDYVSGMLEWKEYQKSKGMDLFEGKNKGKMVVKV